jgi:hypothetical protein
MYGIIFRGKMKNRIIALVVGIVLLLFTILYAQAPDTLWTRTYGGGNVDYARTIEPTTDGGYIIVGTSYSFSASFPDIYIVKMD